MAMATVGIGAGRIVMLVGAGVAGSVVLRNGRLSEILTEIQVRLKFTTCQLLSPPLITPIPTLGEVGRWLAPANLVSLIRVARPCRSFWRRRTRRRKAALAARTAVSVTRSTRYVL
jgi:hypothetical protein